MVEVLALPGRWFAWLRLVTKTTMVVVGVLVFSIVTLGGQNATEVVEVVVVVVAVVVVVTAVPAAEEVSRATTTTAAVVANTAIMMVS